jgi:hypothetical protein
MQRPLLLSIFWLSFFPGKAQTTQALANALANAPVGCSVLDRQNHVINHANGFLIRKKNHFYFITNFHIIEDTNYYSGLVHPFYENGRIAEPHFLLIRIRRKRDGAWASEKIGLFSNGKPNYFSMSLGSKKGDVIAFLLEDSSSLNYYPLDYTSANTHELGNGEEIYLVGFPISSSNSPTVRSGKVIQTDSVATTYQGKLPMFLIDLSSPGWYSGSPAFIWSRELNKPLLIGIIGNADEESNTAIWKINLLSKMIDSLP